jgi:hypothetical protein
MKIIKGTKAYLISSLVALVAFAFIYLVGTPLLRTTYTFALNNIVSVKEEPAVVLPPPVTHVSTPSAVKGVYMTACVASMPSLRSKMVKLIDETELNSIVIDIKDFTGTISFKTDNQDAF